jgi:hypothetical protein
MSSKIIGSKRIKWPGYIVPLADTGSVARFFPSFGY